MYALLVIVESAILCGSNELHLVDWRHSVVFVVEPLKLISLEVCCSKIKSTPCSELISASRKLRSSWILCIPGCICSKVSFHNCLCDMNTIDISCCIPISQYLPKHKMTRNTKWQGRKLWQTKNSGKTPNSSPMSSEEKWLQGVESALYHMFQYQIQNFVWWLSVIFLWTKFSSCVDVI